MTSDTADRRDVLLDRIADIVLSEGLHAFALRGLASRLGTSGRMLLYYFTSRDTLVRDTLHRISARMATILAGFAGAPPTTPGALVAAVLQQVRDAEIAPFMRVWTEVVSAGARGETPFDAVAPTVVADWIDWIESRLLPPWQGNGTAAAILALMDGLTLLELASPGTTGAARALLPGLLDGRAGDSHRSGRTNSER